MNSPKPSRRISVFVLAMMNVAVVMSLRGLPMMAKEGMTLVFYLLFATIVFLIPVSLVSAELATGWPQAGGVYGWVKEAFGNKVGFVAIWLQWIQNVVWYPTVLAFAAGALSYFFLNPELSTNKFFNVIVILVIYWGATFINFRGIKASGRLTSFGVILGTILPGIFIIALGIFWISSHHPIAFSLSKSMIPDFRNFSSLSFLAGIVLLFAGMEVSAVHANEVKNPKKNYPKAIFLAVVIILGVFSLGSLAIGAVVPSQDINLTTGVMQAFSMLLSHFHMPWLLPVIGCLVAFGTIGGVAAWIIGPSKGLLHTARAGDIPPFLEKINDRGVPVGILWIQGGIVTIISLVYLLMPNVSSAFFLLTDLTAILYLVMYVLLFSAAIRLRYTAPKVVRSYKIPGGYFGIWCVSGLALLGALFAICVGLIPPKQLPIGSNLFFVLFLSLGLLVFISLPLIILHFKKPSWKTDKD